MTMLLALAFGSAAIASEPFLNRDEALFGLASDDAINRAQAECVNDFETLRCINLVSNLGW